ncbi:putative transcriptional regulator, MarR family protein [Paractinoplanes abujensis]|uniref:DNA-binding MarR family transcriptional regulator n=1 Tax=Paractinoplanes abujensis TaxID=882441 RepID=A0A7W7G4D4_9ACTN|nr:MarR family transcriptional regulator [Actinoplanes abujensis]MBB4693701.1 DNA-binding MarR family transcriptional regulator [Actinoplanes abujensis]GID21642.1 putative transcriptional regulator, MarR family protein [Actinoplanes abujensis]
MEEREDLGAMVFRLGRLLLAMEQPILDRHGVSMWAYAVLTALRESPMRTQAALAAGIGADKTRLIPVLDELQKRGLIEREPDPSDRRVRLLDLTDAGRQVHQAIQSEVRAGEADLLAAFPPADRDGFLRALIALTKR